MVHLKPMAALPPGPPPFTPSQPPAPPVKTNKRAYPQIGPQAGLDKIYTHLLELTQTGELKWRIRHHQPCYYQKPDGSDGFLYSDLAYAVDPKMERPDRTHQKYTFTVWLSKEAGKGLLIRGENQEEKEGIIFPQKMIGEKQFHQLIETIQQSHPQEEWPIAPIPTNRLLQWLGI